MRGSSRGTSSGPSRGSEVTGAPVSRCFLGQPLCASCPHPDRQRWDLSAGLGSAPSKSASTRDLTSPPHWEMGPLWIQLSGWGHAGGGAWRLAPARRDVDTYGRRPRSDGARIRDAPRAGDPRVARGQERGLEHRLPLGLRRNQPGSHLGLGLRACGPREDEPLWRKPPSAWHLVTAALGSGGPALGWARGCPELTRVRPADRAQASGHCVPGALSPTHHLRAPAPHLGHGLSAPRRASRGAGGGGGPRLQRGEVAAAARPAAWDAGHKEAVPQGRGGQPLCRERAGLEQGNGGSGRRRGRGAQGRG